jgi:hypothetical protein
MSWGALAGGQAVTDKDLRDVLSGSPVGIPTGPVPTISGVPPDPLLVQYTRHADFHTRVEVYENGSFWKAELRAPGTGTDNASFTGMTLGALYKARTRRQHDGSTFLVATGAGLPANEERLTTYNTVNLYCATHTALPSTSQIPNKTFIQGFILLAGAFGDFSTELQYGDPA